MFLFLNSDIYYLKYINALRVNNYTAAQECFYTYFDLKKSPRLPGGVSSGSGGSGIGTAGMNSLNGGQANGTSNGSSASDGAKNGIGGLHSSGSNICWSALNLAIMYAHFRHYRLAYDALTDCISVAREKRDERCLQFAMIWLLLVLQQFNATPTNMSNVSSNGHSSHGTSSMIPNGTAANFRGATSSSNRSAQNRAAELSHRHHKAYDDLNLIQNLINLIAINEYSMPYIAAMAYLHLEKQIYLRSIYPSLLDQQLGQAGSGGTGLFGGEDGKPASGPKRPPLTTKPLILAVRYLMDDVLMKSYASHAAVLNAYGAVHLAATMSNLLARLDLVDMVDQEMIAHVTESQAIAARNQAFYQVRI